MSDTVTTAPHQRPLQAAAHAAVLEVLRPGDIAVDATVGNGHDTLLLAQAVGDTGRVYGFDVQVQALDGTRQRLAQAGLAERVVLFHCGHEHVAQRVPREHHGQVRVLMFNLGYLPRSDKRCVTRWSTTQAALEQGLAMLAPGGRIAVMAYTGHPGGQEEAAAVAQWAQALPAAQVRVTRVVNEARRGPAPELTVLERPA